MYIITCAAANPLGREPRAATIGCRLNAVGQTSARRRDLESRVGLVAGLGASVGNTDGLYWATVETTYGWVTIFGRSGKLLRLELPKPTQEDALATVPPGAEESPERFGHLPDKLKRYFAGERVSFECEIGLDGLGPFEKRVLTEAMKIPYGRVATYGQIAKALGRPQAARAVGNAMAKNPIPIVIPCHRVVRSGGGLGGFGGGLQMKRRLLAMEGVEL